jgi:hypothetical protein
VRRRRLVFGGIATVCLAAALLVVVPWWRGPAPESEAAKYFDELAPGRVEIENCTYAEDPEGSETDNYLCTLTARQAVPPGSPGAADIPRGRSTVCFHIFRSAMPLERVDADAFPSRDREPPCV